MPSAFSISATALLKHLVELPPIGILCFRRANSISCTTLHARYPISSPLVSVRINPANSSGVLVSDHNSYLCPSRSSSPFCDQAHCLREEKAPSHIHTSVEPTLLVKHTALQASHCHTHHHRRHLPLRTRPPSRQPCFLPPYSAPHLA